MTPSQRIAAIHERQERRHADPRNVTEWKPRAAHVRRRAARLLIGQVFGTRTVEGVTFKKTKRGERVMLVLRCTCGERQIVEPHQAREYGRCFSCAMLDINGSRCVR